MTLNRNRLYSILFIACLAGYIWLFNIIINDLSNNKSFDVCLIKKVTNIPCPSCGSTRSIVSLIKGDFFEALILNPIGYLVSIIMIIAPVWICLDLIMRSNSLFNSYLKIEYYLKKPKYSIPLILFLIINWIWNINKGL